MSSFRIELVILPILILTALTGGCVTNQISDNHTAIIPTAVLTTTPKSVALYQVTINQEEGSHADYIQIDSDVYNQGEIVEFYLTNSGSEQLRCDSVNPTFLVSYKTDNGSWRHVITESGPIQVTTGPRPIPPTPSFLDPGHSTPAYRLITNDWKPGLYRISFNCHYPVEVTEGEKSTVEYQPVFHDFTLREKPGIQTDNEGVK
jgi:hypothetical protein